MKLKFAAGLLAVALAAGPVLAPAETPAPPTISVLTAQKKPISEDLNVTGTFAAGDMVLVSPEIEGLAVTEYLAEEGDSVKKGQVLVRLSSVSIDNDMREAIINHDKAVADLDRAKKLIASGVTTPANLDQLQATADIAAKQIAAVSISKAHTEIKSPVDGYIAQRTVQLGAIASASRSPLYQIVRDGAIELLAEVPESDLPRVKEGQQAAIMVNGFDKPVEGTVKLISPMINQQTRIGIVHIGVASERRIPIGAFGRAVITLASANAVVLPLTAVTFGANGPTVQVVKDGKVEVRKVVTGLMGTDEIEITQGVAEGETFVARAGSFVRDGDAVTPVALKQ
jgi:RND family efflux transporter MFP subunit